MQIVLMRHGHDIGSPNGDRVLSKRGREHVSQTAQHLHRLGIPSFEVALCSPSIRAQQTLDVFRDSLPCLSPVATESLSPDSDVLSLLGEFESLLAQNVLRCLVVGHEPQLSNTILGICGQGIHAVLSSAPPLTISRGAAAFLDWRIDEPAELDDVLIVSGPKHSFARSTQGRPATASSFLNA